jgi:DNA replication and repair protein RecF
MRSLAVALALSDFRSYTRAELATGGASVFLVGPNGAGKTNLLEAVSLLSPGRGMRRASLPELGRRVAGEPEGRTWSVLVTVVLGDVGEARIGTGVESPGASRRIVRIDGVNVPPGRMAELARPLWVTPAQDRLFLEGAAERRRFFDRLVFAAEPIHAAHVGAYEQALRERSRLLDAAGDPA